MAKTQTAVLPLFSSTATVVFLPRRILHLDALTLAPPPPRGNFRLKGSVLAHFPRSLLYFFIPFLEFALARLVLFLDAQLYERQGARV